MKVADQEAWNKKQEAREQKEANLLKSIAAKMPALEELLQRCHDHWGYEDPVYRFYHQSFKVYYLQETTREIVASLQALAPDLTMNGWFLEIVQQGTGKEFSPQDNENWTTVTRPILEAFFHARYFLEMVCKYGEELDSPPKVMPSGYASVLYLFNLR
jgi:hypothetical protein